MSKEHAEEIVNQIFTIFDRDANGHLDFVEFLTATDMTTNGSPEEKLRNISKEELIYHFNTDHKFCGNFLLYNRLILQFYETLLN